MNRNLIIISLALLCLNDSYAQIKNSGFELWETVFNYDKPSSWWSNQDSTSIRIERDSLAIEGNYSLKMLPSVASSWQGCESKIIGRANFDTILPDSSVLTLYVKSVPQDAEDNLVYLIIFGFLFSSDSVVGGFDWRAETPLFEFEKIEIPLSGHNIDEMSIFIYGGASTHPLDGPCLNRSYSWIDAMSIEAKTTYSNFPNKQKHDFIIYPNPSRGLINILQPGSQRLEFELYSVYGELVDKGEIDDGQFFIDNQGIYFLKLFSDFNPSNIYTYKLIIIE